MESNNANLADRVAALETRFAQLETPLRALGANLADREAVSEFVSSMLRGYEAALIAILLRLSERGVLPAREAKRAVEGAYASLPPEAQRGPTGTVLREIAETLGRPPGSEPAPRH